MAQICYTGSLKVCMPRKSKQSGVADRRSDRTFVCNRLPLMPRTKKLNISMRNHSVPLLPVRAAIADRCSQQSHVQERITCTL